MPSLLLALAVLQGSFVDRTAESIPGARLVVVEGMGHDLPPSLAPRMIDEVLAFTGEHS